MNRFASAGRDQGIAMYNQETLEWQERMKLDAGKKIAVAVPTDDFIKDALALFDSPPKPDGEAT